MAPEVGKLIRRMNAHPQGRDAAAAVLYLLFGVALLQFGGFRLAGVAVVSPESGVWNSETMFLLLLIVMAILATLRSAHPFFVLTAGIPIVAVDALLGTSLGVLLLFSDFVYCAFRYGADRGLRVVLIAIIATFLGIGLVLLAWPAARAPFGVLALQWALFVLPAALWGWNVRSERQRTKAEMAAFHARSTQRLRQRVAHDLHDLVANQIAVAGLNIEAARLGLSPDRAEHEEVEESLSRAKKGTDEAHREMRRLIALLTAVDAVEDAPDQIRSGSRLIDLVPADRTLVHHGGSLDDAIAAMPPRSAEVVLRVMQELVMNAVKHGSGDIGITVPEHAPDDGSLNVRVSNDVADAVGQASGSGIGITGATVLLSEVGGEIVSGEDGDGRWLAAVTFGAVVAPVEVQHV